MDTIRDDLKEIKADIKQLIVQTARQEVRLETHEARSLALQQEQKLQAQALKPIQTHVDFVNSAGKTLLAVLTGVAIYVIGRLLF